MFAPEFNPIAFSIGLLAVHWYGLMYLLGFAFFWALGRLRAKDPWRQMTANDVEDILFYGVLGVILGGRLGFCLFYQPEWYLSHPLDIFKVWQGGMSAHGGIIGSILAICAFARIKGKTFLDVADFVAPLVPLGLMFGRIGNFINGELWGKTSDVPWAMIFPTGGPLPRHPSQLYEAALEGVLLFVVLWLYAARPRKRGAVAGLFALGYGVCRFAVEFVRVPDAQLGYLAFGWLTMGQLLCLPLMAAGLWLLCRTPRERAAVEPATAPRKGKSARKR